MPSVQEQVQKAKESAQAAEAVLIFKEAGIDRLLGRAGESDEQREQRKKLFDLQFDQERDLRKHGWPKVILRAIRRNNHTFFRNLGKVLGRKPMPDSARLVPTDKLDWFLVEHWSKASDGLPKLSQLTWPSLLDVCTLALKNQSLTLESVRQHARRLGLKPVAFPRFAVISTKPKLRLKRLDKQA